MRRALVIVSKAPRAGTSKTRLVPPLTRDEAADLSRAFLHDTVALGLSLGWESVRVVHPQEDGEALRAMLPLGVTCVPQLGHGLGDALLGAFDQCFADGFTRVVLIDSDSPTLPPRIIQQAAELLHTHDVTVGPSADGGYYLLGLTEPWPRLFEDIMWSTDAVYQQTLERASTLRVATLEEWFDVDTPSDLVRLEDDLRRAPPATAEHTRAAMQRLRLHVAR